MLRVLWLAACHILLATLGEAAEDATPDDFSAGFEKLQSLGLPVLPEGTKWSTLPDSGGRLSHLESTLPRGTKGNGWLLPPDADGHLEALPAGSITLVDIDAEKPASPGLLSRVLGGDSKPQPTTREADLTPDLEKILTEVGKKSDNDDDPFDEDSYSNRRKAEQYGPLLILAAQMHQTGNRAQANELAAALFKSYPNREAVLDSAVNRIAESHYKSATDAFFRTLDWKTYQDSIRSLIERFPRGWQNQSAAALLASALAQRETTGQPAIPRLKDIPLDPAALESIAWMLAEKSTGDVAPAISPEIAAQLEGVPAQYRAQYLESLMEGNNSVSRDRSSNWLLIKQAELDAASDVATPTRRLGIAALPVLAALADDSWLTALKNPNAGNGNYISSDAGPTERTLHAFASLERPATRGELATTLLQSCLPDPDGELRSVEPLVLRDVALEFWQKHRNDTPEAIALAFLSDGSSEQKSKAATLLAQSTNPDDQLALESHILESPSPLSQLVTVRAIIPLRKAAAKPFLDRYIKALRAEVATVGSLEDIDGLPWEIREMKSIEPLIKQLESQVSGQSPQARAREIARENDPKTVEIMIRGLRESLAKVKPRTRFLAMLAGAVATDDTKVREIFINQIMDVGYDGEADDESSDTDRTLPAGEVKAWKILLADERLYPSSTNPGTEVTISGLAACALESSVNPGASDDFTMARNVTGMTEEDLAFPRAMARLNNESIPPLPDASKVKPDRLKEIITNAGSKQPAEIHPYLKTLSNDERAAWLTWLEEPGETPIPENVRKLDSVITERGRDQWILSDTPGVADIHLGFDVNESSLTSHIQHLAAALEKHSRSVVIIGVANFPPGLQVLAQKIDLPEEKPSEDPDRDPFAEGENYYGSPKQWLSEVLSDLVLPDPKDSMVGAVHLSLSANRTDINRSWRIIDGKAVQIRSSNNDEDDLNSTFTRIIADHKLFNLNIQILSRSDAERFTESQ